ncbi:MAG: hypothetical protein AABY80_01260 [Candidatus Deferrimicrobiota bacterium]
MAVRASRRILLTFLFLMMAGFLSYLVAASQFDPRFNPHSLFGKADRCPKCHIHYREDLEPTRFLPDCNDVCMGCHSAEKLGRSHPNQVRPRDKYWKMKVPADFHLDDDGRIMCLTCHKAHGPFLSTVKAFAKQRPENARPPAGVPGYYRTFFLRLSDPEKGFAVLCDGCHKLL